MASDGVVPAKQLQILRTSSVRGLVGTATGLVADGLLLMVVNRVTKKGLGVNRRVRSFIEEWYTLLFNSRSW